METNYIMKMTKEQFLGKHNQKELDCTISFLMDLQMVMNSEKSENVNLIDDLLYIMPIDINNIHQACEPEPDGLESW